LNNVLKDMPWKGEGAPPLPAGYYMVKELEQNITYKMNEGVKSQLKYMKQENKIIAFELFDEMLFKATGVHLFEAAIETIEH
jgi:hypothetical protein